MHMNLQKVIATKFQMPFLSIMTCRRKKKSNFQKKMVKTGSEKQIHYKDPK